MEILIPAVAILGFLALLAWGAVHSGRNVDDPYRDVGNGGMTERESVAQFIRERNEAGRPLSEEELQFFRERGEL